MTIQEEIEDIKSIYSRYYKEEHLKAAERIAAQVRSEVESNTGSELSKFKKMGYRADVGSPHQWWENHCEEYRKIDTAFPKDSDFTIVCLLADALLSDIPERD